MSLTTTGILDISENFILPTTGSMSLWCKPVVDTLYNPSGIIFLFSDGVDNLSIGSSGTEYFLTGNVSGSQTTLYFSYNETGIDHCSLYWNNNSQTGIFYLNNNKNIISDFKIPTGIINKGEFYPASSLSEVGMWSIDISNSQEHLYQQYNATHFRLSNLEMYFPLGGLYGTNLNDYSKNQRQLVPRQAMCCDFYILTISGAYYDPINGPCSGNYQCLNSYCPDLNGTFILTPPITNSGEGEYEVILDSISTGEGYLEVQIGDVTCNASPTEECIIINNIAGTYYLFLERTSDCSMVGPNVIAVGDFTWTDWQDIVYYPKITLNITSYNFSNTTHNGSFVITCNTDPPCGYAIYNSDIIPCTGLLSNGITVTKTGDPAIITFPANIIVQLYPVVATYKAILNSAGVLLRIDVSYLTAYSTYKGLSNSTFTIFNNPLQNCQGFSQNLYTNNNNLNGYINCSNFTIGLVECSGYRNPWDNKHLPPLLKYS